MESPLNTSSWMPRRSRAVADGRIWCNEMPHLGYAVLRGDTAEAGFAELVQQVTGLALPLKAGAVSQGPQGVLMWTSPDEWLLVSHRQRLADWTAQLDAGFAAQSCLPRRWTPAAA
jgi:sarcosine oxidase subunit gamma